MTHPEGERDLLFPASLSLSLSLSLSAFMDIAVVSVERIFATLNK